MATTRRTIFLEEIERIRLAGQLDASTYEALRRRYAEGAQDERLDEPLAPADTVAAAAPSGEPRASFASSALQLVGGILLGAGVVALTVFLHLESPRAPLALLGFAILAAAGAWGIARAGNAGLADAAYAAALVTATVASLSGERNDGLQQVIGGVAALLALAVVFAQRGRGPLVAGAVVAYALSSGAFSIFDRIFDERANGWALVWQLALLAMGALLVWLRRETWATVGLGILVAPLAIDAIAVARQLGIRQSLGMEIAVGLYLLAVLGLGIGLRNRGLVVGAAAGLTVDAVVFAFDVGGPGTAVVVLLALGGLLVWQASVVRAYFRRPA